MIQVYQAYENFAYSTDEQILEVFRLYLFQSETFCLRYNEEYENKGQKSYPSKDEEQNSSSKYLLKAKSNTDIYKETWFELYDTV